LDSTISASSAYAALLTRFTVRRLPVKRLMPAFVVRQYKDQTLKAGHFIIAYDDANMAGTYLAGG
jgi:hypothetical protein